ncbi:MAG: sigma-70 family RNA polymerase sigma factor [Romboutsia timonensis]
MSRYLSNEQLIEIGDIEQLYILNKNLIYHACNNFKNIADADEIESIAYVVFVESVKTYDSKLGKWSTYFYKCLKNKVLNSLNKFTIYNTEIYSESTYEINNIIDYSFLTKREQQVLKLIYEGFKQIEISKILNISQPCVSITKRRIQVKIKKEMSI